MEEIWRCEESFTNLEAVDFKENSNAPFFEAPNSNDRSHNKLKEGRPHNETSGQIRGYVQNRDRSFKKQENLYRKSTPGIGVRTGYLSSKRPGEMQTGYLSLASKQANISGFSKGYLQTSQALKNRDNRGQPSFPQKITYSNPGPLKEDKFHQQAGTLYGSLGINTNSIDIQKFAGRILYLKEAVRGIEQIIA